MAKEITMNVGLTVVSQDPATGMYKVYFNVSAQNQQNLSTIAGPYVGTVSVPTTGKVIDLSGVQGGVPGVCWLHNQDPTNPVSIGTRDTTTGKFSPFLRLPPLTRYPVILDPHLGIEESGAGSGSVGTCQLFAKAFNGTCIVDFEVFPQ